MLNLNAIDNNDYKYLYFYGFNYSLFFSMLLLNFRYLSNYFKNNCNKEKLNEYPDLVKYVLKYFNIIEFNIKINDDILHNKNAQILQIYDNFDSLKKILDAYYVSYYSVCICGVVDTLNIN